MATFFTDGTIIYIDKAILQQMASTINSIKNTTTIQLLVSFKSAV